MDLYEFQTEPQQLKEPMSARSNGVAIYNGVSYNSSFSRHEPIDISHAEYDDVIILKVNNTKALLWSVTIKANS